MNEYIFVSCPHCEGMVMIKKSDLNCHIFRHAALRTKLDAFVNPHEKKDICDKLADEGKIHGCGKPFKILTTGKTEYKAVICDYI